MDVYLGNKLIIKHAKLWTFGDIIINQANDKKHTLANVCRVLEITKNLILAVQLDDSNLVVTIEKGSWKILRSMTILKGPKNRSFYALYGTAQKSDDSNLVVAPANKGNDVQVSHNCLGHLSEHDIRYCNNINFFLPLSIHIFIFLRIAL